jgi:hypothetical protein
MNVGTAASAVRRAQLDSTDAERLARIVGLTVIGFSPSDSSFWVARQPAEPAHSLSQVLHFPSAWFLAKI